MKHISQALGEALAHLQPGHVAAELSRMRMAGGSNDPKAWALRLRDRENAGERLTIAQRDMWRAALRVEINQAQGAA